MKLVAFFLMVLSGPVFGGDSKTPDAPVAVYVRFEHASSQKLREILQADVQAILAPLGFNLQWRTMETAGKEAWVDLALVTFKGHCDLSSTSKFNFVPGALGETRVSDGRIQPFADIDCDRIGALLTPGLTSLRRRDRERLFQRAVARVVAHELYHILVRTSAHESTGVGKAEVTASDLLADRFPFHPAQAHALLKTSADDALQLSRNRQ